VVERRKGLSKKVTTRNCTKGKAKPRLKKRKKKRKSIGEPEENAFGQNERKQTTKTGARGCLIRTRTGENEKIELGKGLTGGRGPDCLVRDRSFTDRRGREPKDPEGEGPEPVPSNSEGSIFDKNRI